MEIARSSLKPASADRDIPERPRTASFPALADLADRSPRLKQRVVFVLSAVAVCLIFPAALATAVYYLAYLLWAI